MGVKICGKGAECERVCPIMRAGMPCPTLGHYLSISLATQPASSEAEPELVSQNP